MIFTFVLSFYLPWWIIVIVSFLAGFLLYGSGFSVFLSGFLGGGILWLGYAWVLDVKTNAILSEKIVKLFPFSDPFYLIILSGFIGAMMSGLGGLTGNSFRWIFMKKKSKSFYS